MTKRPYSTSLRRQMEYTLVKVLELFDHYLHEGNTQGWGESEEKATEIYHLTYNIPSTNHILAIFSEQENQEWKEYTILIREKLSIANTGAKQIMDQWVLKNRGHKDLQTPKNITLDTLNKISK